MAKYNQPPPIKDSVTEDKSRLSTHVWRRWYQGLFNNLATKADILDSASEDNLVVFDADGNLADGGIDITDVIEPSDIGGTTNQITVTDNSDGTVTISLPSTIITPGILHVTGVLKKLTATLLGTPEPGAIEYSNDRFYITNVTTQRAIDRTSDVLTSTVTVANTTDETVLFTGILAANVLKVGNIIKVEVGGVISKDDAANQVTIRIKIGTTTIATLLTTVAGVLSDAHWDCYCKIIVRSVGATGTLSTHADMEAASDSTNAIMEAQVVDTTTSENITVTAQWNTADADDSISIYQGYMEFKN